MATVPEGGHTSVRSMLPILSASTIGTAIEWYDFFLYGFLAATVFPKVFFPTLDPVAGTIASFTTNFVGFLARPIGGAFFGWFGDRVGRKSTLIATLLLMGIATALMGFLPGYAQIGLAAPILLSILRFLQGAGVGGEWGGSVLLSLEYGDDRRRGFWTSWPQTGVPVGLALAAIAVLAFQAIFPGAAFESIGWRIPFFLSVVLIFVGLYIRLRPLLWCEDAEVELRLTVHRSHRYSPLQFCDDANLQCHLRPHWTQAVVYDWLCADGNLGLPLLHPAANEDRCDCCRCDGALC